MRARDILIVTGMHRSGTSFLAAALARLGYALPEDRGAGADDNPEGHNESAAVTAVNDALLARAGTDWLGARDLTPAQAARLAASPVARQIEDALAAAYPGQGPILVKDPRLSTLLPVWRAAPGLQDLRFVAALAVRQPGDVARSLKARNGTRLRLGHLAWTVQTLAALRTTAGLRRALFLYPAWHLAPDAASQIADLTGRSRAECGRAIADAAGAFRPDFDHSGASQSAVRSAETDLAVRLFERVADVTRTGVWPGVRELARFRSEAEALAASPGWKRISDPPGLQRQKAASAALRADLAVLRARSCVIAAERSGLSAAMSAMEQERGNLREMLLRTEGQREEAHSMIAARLADAEVLRLQVFRTEAQRDALAARIEEERDRHEAALAEAGVSLREAASEKERLVASLAAALDEARHARRDAETGLSAEVGRRNEAEVRLAAAEVQLGACDAERLRLGAETASLQRALATSDNALTSAAEAIVRLEADLRRERQTVLRPIYRNLWVQAGRIVRKTAGHRAAEALKRHLPQPERVPASLALPLPLPSPPMVKATGEGVSATVRAPQGKSDIFVFSIIDWCFRIQRPQHMAREFAARGHRVFYIEMQKEPGPTEVREQQDGVWIVSLGCHSGDLVPAYTGQPGKLAAQRWTGSFAAFCEAVGATDERILVVQHPYWWGFVRHLPPENRLVFDCMDEISGFSNSAPHVIAAEDDLAGAADDLIVSSGYLARKFSPRRGVTLIRNAAAVDDFRPEPAPALPGFLAGHDTGGIRVGYVGAIAEWFDTDLVHGAAEAAPDLQFHLCGAVTSPEAAGLARLPNVTLHGEITFRDVPGFIAAMDVMTIPFRLLPIIRACDPVKFYEHSAMAKPTVATALPELDRCGDLLYRAGTVPDFLAAIRLAKAASEEAGFRGRLTDFAASNTWAHRAEAFLDAVGAHPLVSVVVLSWGSADLTLAALHSLAGPVPGNPSPAWPRLDIIVVDNGSPEAEVARLREWSAGRGNVRIIENGANLGFAAGNNVGIAAARGEYVLLLNNDTFVPPGAIAALVGHLARSPEIGVVGPLTNNIGNEARVEIAYSDMDGMVRAARRLVTGHRGRWSEIDVAAFFCAMFRKSDLDRFGGLSEDYGLGMFEDDDLCARIRRQGQVCALAEDAFVHHHLSASFGTLDADRRHKLFERNRAIFEARWGAWPGHRYRAARPPGTLEAA